jgi:trans-aconitate methyltransferase
MRDWPLLRALRRWSLRHRQYRGGVDILDALYEKADPWNLASAHEAARFAATNALIAEHVPNCKTLLEIGSGEGLQTRELLRVANQVTGIEGSATALMRARDNVPNATFILGDFSQDIPEIQRQHYDLATLCEVLYYIEDPQAALTRAQSLANAVLVTIYEPQAAALAMLFKTPSWRSLNSIDADKKRWRVYLWQSARI